MITTSLQGSPLISQIHRIALMEFEAQRTGTTTIYLSTDFEEHYRNTIFRNLNITDTIEEATTIEYIAPVAFDVLREYLISSFVLSPESIKEVDDPIITAVCVDGYRENIDYFRNAMEFVGDSTFLFISDDIEWCKKHFSGENVYYSPLTDRVEQLSLIARCSNVILGDSLLADFGALMGETIHSKIVVPVDTLMTNLPSSWHRI